MHFPESLSEKLNASWDSHEHKRSISIDKKKCYWNFLNNIKNIRTVGHDLAHLGGLSEVHKSDFIRWELLAEEGGLWSDLDILYIKSIEEVYFNIESPVDIEVDDFPVRINPDTVREVVCVSSFGHGQECNSIGFLMCAPGSLLFNEVCNLRNFIMRESELEEIGSRYQSLGRRILDLMIFQHPFLVGDPSYRNPALSEQGTAILGSDFQLGSYSKVPLPGALNIPMDVVYPYGDRNVNTILEPNRYENFLVTERTIGLHWYGGHAKVGPFMSSLSEELIEDLPDSIIRDLIFDILEKNKSYLFPA